MSARGRAAGRIMDVLVLAVAGWALVDAWRVADRAWPLAVVVVGAWTAAMLARDRRPRLLLAVPVVLGAQAAVTGAFPNDSGSTVLAVLLGAALYGARTGSLRALLGGAAVWLLGMVPLGITMGNDPVGDVVFPTAFSWILLVGGGLVARGRARLHGVTAEARTLEQRLEADRNRILAKERQRIARELNDVVTQTVSAVQVQLSAARAIVAGPDPTAAVPVLLDVEDAAREATAELRRMLGLLRGDTAGAAVPADVSSEAIRGLTGWTGAGHLDVRIDPRVADLPAGLQVALYRLVETALEDASEGRPAERGHVEAAVTPDRLVVEVRHDGTGSRAAAAALRERTAVFGGHLDHDDTAGRQLRIELPIRHRPAQVPT